MGGWKKTASGRKAIREMDGIEARKFRMGARKEERKKLAPNRRMGRKNVEGIGARKLRKEERKSGRKKAQDRRNGSRKLNRIETGKLLKEVRKE